MPIPKYDELMLPLLQILQDQKEYNLKDVRDSLALKFNLTDLEKTELLPSGTQTVFDNRVGWAKSYLKNAGLLDSPKRGTLVITKRGLDTLLEKINKIDRNYLLKFDEFKNFQSQNLGQEKETIVPNEEMELTPHDQFLRSLKKINDQLENELLEQVLKSSPFNFEKIVIDLLLNLGYGGSRKEAGTAFSKSGDGGIDGIIKEDKLGLDVIYVQAKRWKIDSSVGRPEIQKFVGAIHGQRAKKGVFITTSYFSKEAHEYVQNIESKIILIDGDKLCELMIESNTGLSVEQKIEIKKIDTDYFNEF